MDSVVSFRFKPTPEELVSHYLKKKRHDPAFTCPSITEVVNINKYHPCELPGLAAIHSDDPVWYFFCTPDRRCANSNRISRTAKGGFWKVTGKDREVKGRHGNKPIGVKKTLVFYEGQSNFRQENRTNWIMHEYHEDHRNNDSVFQGKVVCRLVRKPKHLHAIQPMLQNNVAEEDVVPELVTQQLQDLRLAPAFQF